MMSLVLHIRVLLGPRVYVYFAAALCTLLGSAGLILHKLALATSEKSSESNKNVGF